MKSSEEGALSHRCRVPRRVSAVTARLYVNPAWRWYHGDNVEGRSRGLEFGEWFGLPKPSFVRHVLADGAIQQRFHHVRDHAWLEALGPLPHGTLAEMQRDMPGWPSLFAFHAFTAAWAASSDDERIVLLDVLEDRYVGDACRGRMCEAKPP